MIFSRRSELEPEDLACVGARAPARAGEPHVLVPSSGVAWAALIALLCDPDDEILVPAPGPPRLARLARLVGADVAPYPLRRAASGEWAYDAAAIYDAVGERTRAIALLSPHDPTGACLDAEVAEALDAIGIPLICDESRAASVRGAPASAPSASLLGAPRDTLCLAIRARDAERAPRISVCGPDDEARSAIERLSALVAPMS